MIDAVNPEEAATGSDLKRTRRKKFTTDVGKIDRLPPHSTEAEQGVLGCLLLSPNDCIGESIEKFKVGAEIFYDLRHQAIYEILVQMYEKKEPIDLITLPQKLKDNHQLEAVGGLSYISSLTDAVPSAANLSYYADIIFEKYVLRKMIQTCTDIVGRAYSHEGEVDQLLDEVERDVLKIVESRVEETDKSMKKLVQNAVTMIEDFFNKKGSLTGIATGFTDLDKMTSGFQPGDMIIIAARPSMGKCLAFDSEILLADGSVATIQEIYRTRGANLLTLKDDWKLGLTAPSHFVDDGLKPVFRVTTRLGRVVEATLPHPFRTLQGWTKLGELKPGDQIAVPRVLEVFGQSRWKECEVKLLAYLIGDGCLTDSNPQFTNDNMVVRKEFSEAVADFGQLTVKESDSNGTRTVSMRVAGDRALIRSGRLEFGKRLGAAISSSGRSSRQVALAAGVSPVSVHEWKKGNCAPTNDAFAKLCGVMGAEASALAPAGLEVISKNSRNALTLWLEQLGLWGKDAHAKFIPAPVFTLTRPQLALFLNRLFATDGWATVLASGQAQLGYATVSEKLARHLQHLLLRFGVIASLRKRSVKYGSTRRMAWQLDITDGRSIRTFLSEIGIFGKEKATTAVLKALENRRYQTNRDLIPREIWTAITSAKGEESWAALARRAGIQGHSNIHVGKRSLTRARLAGLALALKDDALQMLATSDVYWDEIVSIESVGRKQVYDLTIPETHNFVANDICVHNTSLAMNIAEHVAIEEKLPVGVFSLEMTAQSLVLRMLCSHSRVNLRNIRDGFMSERDFPKLVAATGKLSSAPLFVDDSAGLSILQLRAKARRMHTHYGIKLFIIDYLQLLHSTAARSKENRQQEIADISSGIKALAKELSVPIIVLSQLNREIEKDKGRKPRLSDLRESGSIEQDADLVGLLYKDREEDEEATSVPEGEAVEVKLLIAKQRNGPTGDVPLMFLRSFTRFENAAKISAEDADS
jgi:replicative DNA helicase